MLDSRDKYTSMYRSGVGPCDLGSDGREGESSARKIHGMEKKLIKYKNCLSEKLHRQVVTAVKWGYPVSRSSCDKPKHELISLVCCGRLYAGTWRSDRSYVQNGFNIDAMVTDYNIVSSCRRAFCAICDRMANIFRRRVVCKKTRENISELNR